MWNVMKLEVEIKHIKRWSFIFLLMCIVLSMFAAYWRDDQGMNIFAMCNTIIASTALVCSIVFKMLAHDLCLIKELPLIIHIKDNHLVYVNDYDVIKYPWFKWKVSLHAEQFCVDIEHLILYIQDDYHVVEGDD